jgi:hypothetical protein
MIHSVSTAQPSPPSENDVIQRAHVAGERLDTLQGLQRLQLELRRMLGTGASALGSSAATGQERVGCRQRRRIAGEFLLAHFGDQTGRLRPKFDSKTDKRLISFRPNGQKCYNASAVRLALAG